MGRNWPVCTEPDLELILADARDGFGKLKLAAPVMKANAAGAAAKGRELHGSKIKKM